MKLMILKKIGKILPIIGIILLIYIINNIGIEKIANTFLLIPIYYWILGILPIFPILVLTAYKWQYIGKKQKMSFDLIFLMKIFFINKFFLNIIPGGFGRYVKIMYLKKKSNASIEKCITFSIIDYVTGIIIGLFLALIGLCVLIESSPEIFPLFLVFFILFIIFFIIFMRKSGGKSFYNIFLRSFIPDKYKIKVDKSVESLYEDIPKFKDMIFPFFIELIIWILVGVQVYIIAQSFSINIPFTMFILIHVISSVSAAILTVSIGGLGVREGVFVYLMLSFGVDKEIAFVISISGYIIKALIPSLVGIFFTLNKKLINNHL